MHKKTNECKFKKKNILQLLPCHTICVLYKQGIKLENSVQRQEQRFQLEMLMMSKCLVEMQHMNGRRMPTHKKNETTHIPMFPFHFVVKYARGTQPAVHLLLL